MSMKFEYDGFVVNVVDPVTEEKIKAFLSKLTKKKANPQQFKPWDDVEVEELTKAHALGTPVAEIARHLGRTVSGVTIKMYHMFGSVRHPKVSQQQEITL